MKSSAKPTVTIHALDKKTNWDTGIISLPMPREEDLHPVIDEAQVQAVPVAFWPRSENRPGGPKRPRRMLTFFQPAKQQDQYKVALKPGSAREENTPQDDPAWTWRFYKTNAQEIRSTPTHFYYLKEETMLVLSHKKGQFSLRMGVENEFGLHWWQYLNITPLWSGPLCSAYRIGGHIFTGDDHIYNKEEQRAYDEARLDWTIHASVYLILFNNGLVESTCHWINGRLYGGIGFCPGRPLVGLNGVKADLPAEGLDLTGENMVFPANNMTLDLSPARDLVSVRRPGRLENRDDGWLYWFPLQTTAVAHRLEATRRYENDIAITFPKNHLYRRDASETETSEAFETTVKDSEKGFLQGVSISSTFRLRMGAGPAHIQRFLAEPQWYADQCDLAPLPYEIKTGSFSDLSIECGEHTLKNAFNGSLTRGGIPRYFYQWGKIPMELDFDGNQGRSMMRLAYWKTDPALYRCALNNGYCMADAGMDHSRDIIHYHGDHDHWKTFSMIYQRFTSMVTSYIETGDFYLLESAQAVANHYMALHNQNWPRRGMGRDAEPLSGILALYDYTGDEHYLQFARNFAEHALATLGPNGEWICGAGVGPVMGCNALPGSPWNGGHLSSGFSQYVMRVPDEIPDSWKPRLKAFLRQLFKLLDEEHHGYHPASSGFLGMQHWFLACFLGDEQLIQMVRSHMEKLLEYHEHPWEEFDMFHGGKAHHQYNYMDQPLFYQATKDTLPEILKQKSI